MRIAADTNLLVRALVQDDEAQAVRAQQELEQASSVVFTLPALCELCWVLSNRYRYRNSEIAEGLRLLIGGDTAVLDHSAVDAGLAMLDAGGDFADGVIAHSGRAMRADAFVSFDRDAVKRLNAAGHAARLPADL